jgi:hypothetical protein
MASEDFLAGQAYERGILKRAVDTAVQKRYRDNEFGYAMSNELWLSIVREAAALRKEDQAYGEQP